VSDSNVAVTHHTAVLGDVRLHYALAGSGEPVVLLHGWPQHVAASRDIIPAHARHAVHGHRA
jgi:pimeloyl-ACP methyl ester carboxylesterase